MSASTPILNPPDVQLPKPGPIGRLGRLVLGALSLMFVSSAVQFSQAFITLSHIDPLMYAIVIAITFWVLPEVVDLGLTVGWGRRLRWAILGLCAAAIGLDLILYKEFWGPPLGIILFIVSVLTHTYLGTSHVLAALIATPGCEMRAIPHLAALVRGKSTEAVVCPGHWSAVDTWENKTFG